VNCKWDYQYNDSATTDCSGNPHYNITGLKPYTNYTVEVVAVNPGGCSDVMASDLLLTDEWRKLRLNFIAGSGAFIKISVEAASCRLLQKC
jgi:hypothetical protein